MNHSRPFLPKEYRASDLRQKLDVSSVPNDEKSLHTLFAVLINDIDRRADIHQSLKSEVLEGIAQAWLYFLEEETGQDVEVEQWQHGVSASVLDKSETRPVSSMRRKRVDGPMFDESLRKNHKKDIPPHQFERDMRRLDDLRRKSSHPGLNTAESAEKEELIQKYGIEHWEWWQSEYINDEADVQKEASV